MTELLACDMLSTSLPPAAIKAAGYTAVLRYLRNLTRLEVEGYLAAGLGVGTIFETLANEAALGAAVGASDGKVAASEAAAIGQPWGSLLVVNLADFAASPAQIPAIAAYFDAFRVEAGQYQLGAYGTGKVLEQLAASGRSAVWWQNAMDDNGVPGSVVWPGAWLYQRVSPTLQIAGVGPGQYDEDVIIRVPAFWTASGSTTGGIHVASQGLPVSAYPLKEATPITGGPNVIELYMLGNDGHVYHKWYAGGAWNGPDVLDEATP